tara:strand:- start:205 stop:858 length:654 start_codon:yes stop_codon:yes gene_type:complete
MPYLGPSADFANITRFTYTATGGETSISGIDDNGLSLAFTSGVNLTVHLNGVLLVAGTDYDTNTANTIDNLAALSGGDICEVTVFGLFNVADAIPATGGTFSGAVVFNAAVQGAVNTNTTVTGSTTLDFSSYQNFVLTLTGNATLANPTTETIGQSGFIIFIQDSTGSRTVSLGTDYETAGSAGLTLSTTASAYDIVPYVVKGSNSILLGTPQLAFG